MGNEIDHSERRRHHRHKLKANAVAEFCKKRFFNLVKPRIIRSAAILDISTHGLAFEYEGKQMWSTEFTELSITVGNSLEKVHKVPFHIVSDHTVSSPETTKEMRRCGVKFNGISPEHRRRIEEMINQQSQMEQNLNIKADDNSYIG